MKHLNNVKKEKKYCFSYMASHVMPFCIALNIYILCLSTSSPCGNSRIICPNFGAKGSWVPISFNQTDDVLDQNKTVIYQIFHQTYSAKQFPEQDPKIYPNEKFQAGIDNH